MFSRKIPRVMKYGLQGTLVVGTSAYALKTYKEDIYNSIALVRVFRTARTAVDIGRVYSKLLYNQEWDKKSQEYYDAKHRAHEIGANKLLELCRVNKGVYIKVGQHIGALDYLLPSEYVSTMRILHKNAPENTVEELYSVIKEDLKQDPKELFIEFDEKPLGTASLAQVHRARLKDGTEVAVKVQHRFVRQSIRLDLWWIEKVVNIMSIVFPEFEMQWLVDETKKNIAQELNFLIEGKNAEKVTKLFTQYKWLKVPKIYWDYSTERVLVMDYITGGYVNDIDYINKNKINKMEINQKLGLLYSHMIFECGFVHSDPHPGNIVVKQEPGDSEVSIYLLDHGLYATLTDEFRYNYSKLWLSILGRDRDGMKMYAERLGIKSDLYFLFACMVSGRPWESILKGIKNTKRNDNEKKIFQEFLPDLAHHITQCLENMDRQCLLVLKTNDLIRSIEYALGTAETMCGYMVMTKCCMNSIYKYEKEKSPFFRSQWLSLKYYFSLIILYLYSIYLTLAEKVNIRISKEVKYEVAI